MTSPAEVEARRQKALELHLAGASYAQIAKTLGYGNKGNAYRNVQRALKESQNQADAVEAADTELARLDAMLTGLWPKARKGDLGAIDRVLRIEERRSAILLRDDVEARGAEQKRVTGLSDFEKRLREREQRAAKSAHRSKSG